LDLQKTSMVTPRILPRPEHTVSRKGIDADALKVLYRLKNNGFAAYLVGGGVRDLLLGRRPKDFDISTDAHPQQVKRLFRNCFVVGRRFRLCHVRFGRKVVEVSTFRSHTPPDEGDTIVRRDNTFGTPEEDAFRRDFTVNALFYDIATFSVIDYVNGLPDLQARVIRTIGDPGVRFQEDPVRMLRAVAIACRLGFGIDRDSLDAMRALRGEIVKASPVRVLEEIYKLLRQGASRRTFELLHELGLLAYIFPEADAALSGRLRESLLESLSRLDDIRNAGLVTSDELSNSLLLGTLLVPLGVPLRKVAVPSRKTTREDAEAEAVAPTEDLAAEAEALGGEEDEPEVAGVTALTLPFARRDLDRLRLILLAQGRLREVHTNPRVVGLLAGKSYLDEALRWLEIHGGIPGHELAGHWRTLDITPPPAPEPELEPTPAPARPRGERAASPRPAPPASSAPAAVEGEPGAHKPRRRRRRGRRRPGAPPAAGEPTPE
jgi:poly(A) polymerase